MTLLKYKHSLCMHLSDLSVQVEEQWTLLKKISLLKIRLRVIKQDHK